MASSMFVTRTNLRNPMLTRAPSRTRALIVLLLALALSTAASGYVAAAEPMPTLSPAAASDAEIVFWQTIANSQSRADYEGYLKTYPNGYFVELAKARIATLSAGPQRSVAAPPPNPPPVVSAAPSGDYTPPSAIAVSPAAWSGIWETHKVRGRINVGDGRWKVTIVDRVIEITQTAEYGVCNSKRQWCRPGGALGSPQIIRGGIEGATFTGTYESDNTVGLTRGQRVKTTVSGVLSNDRNQIHVEYSGWIGHGALFDLRRP